MKGFGDSLSPLERLKESDDDAVYETLPPGIWWKDALCAVVSNPGDEAAARVMAEVLVMHSKGSDQGFADLFTALEEKRSGYEPETVLDMIEIVLRRSERELSIPENCFHILLGYVKIPATNHVIASLIGRENG